MTDVVTYYSEENNLKKLCNFLRSSEGPAVREAIEMDKRVCKCNIIYCTMTAYCFFAAF
jgi:hypothetical protein